jgi:hypothetical protein
MPTVLVPGAARRLGLEFGRLHAAVAAGACRVNEGWAKAHAGRLRKYEGAGLPW